MMVNEITLQVHYYLRSETIKVGMNHGKRDFETF